MHLSDVVHNEEEYNRHPQLVIKDEEIETYNQDVGAVHNDADGGGSSFLIERDRNVEENSSASNLLEADQESWFKIFTNNSISNNIKKYGKVSGGMAEHMC